MRRRVAAWRPQFAHAASPRHCRSLHSKEGESPGEERIRPFKRHETEDGEVFFTIAKREEGKDQPRELRPDELFQMPNLVLDLDEAPPGKVREFSAEDKDRFRRDYTTTKRRAATQMRVSDFEALVRSTRKATRDIESKPTNPWRVTDHDVMSVALRGFLDYADPREATAAAAASSEAEPGFRISRLTQSLTKDYASVPQQTTHHDIQRHGSEDANATAAESKDLIDRADPRNKPDPIKQVRKRNGIPLHATKQDELLLRWLLAKQERLHQMQSTQGQASPTSDEVIAALQSERKTTGLRRIIFQWLAANAKSSAPKEKRARQEDKVPKEMRKACVEIMNGQVSGTISQEILTLVNNIERRMPRRTPAWEACIAGLRLRCWAALGLVDYNYAFLLKDVNETVWRGKTDITEDAKAALELWTVALQENDGLRTTGARKQLFSLVTGATAEGKDKVKVPLRALLFRSSTPGDQSTRLRPYEAYINLLGHFGATRTLWKEWNETTHLLSDAKDTHDGAGVTGTSTMWSTIFFRALSRAARISGPRPDLPESVSLDECARLDLEALGERQDHAYAETLDGGEGQAEAISSTMDSIKDVSFEQCMKAFTTTS